MSSRGKLAYSTDRGGSCPSCGKKLARCSCRSGAREPTRGGDVRVARETKGRKGRGVTVVRGLSLEPVELAALAAELKRHCGAGGAVKRGVIEVQGDHRDAIVAELRKRGIDAKRSGG